MRLHAWLRISGHLNEIEGPCPGSLNGQVRDPPSPYVDPFPHEIVDLNAVGKDGRPVASFGIGCWDNKVSSSRPELRRLMLESGDSRLLRRQGTAAWKKSAVSASAHIRAALRSPDSLRWTRSTVSSFASVS